MLLKACAVCLTTDVKFYDMDVGNLRQDYNLVSGLTTQKGNGLPGYLCFECTAHLRRCKQFRDKCHRAHYALTQVLYDQKEITKVALKIIHHRLIDILPSLAHADNNRKHYEEVMFQWLDHNNCNTVKGEIPIVLDSLQGSIEIEVPSYNTNPNIVSVKTECEDTSFEKGFSLDLPNLDDGPKDDLFEQSIKKEPEFSNETNVFQEFFVSNAQECDYIDPQCKEESLLNKGDQEANASNLDDDCANMVPINVEEAKAAVEVCEMISQHVCEVCMKKFISENRLKAHMRMHDKITKPSMDENNQLDDEIIRKRKLANACLKRHRKKKREEAQLQKLLAQNEQDSEQTQQNTLERRRELARERSKRYRDKSIHNNSQRSVQVKERKVSRNASVILNNGVPTSTQCEVCEKYLSNDVQARKHYEAEHPGVEYLKRYMCDVCGHTTKQYANLMVHMRTHTNEKPYECPHCDRRFSMPSNRDRHLVVHTGEKRYQCQLCSRRFTQSSAVKLHIQTVHLKIPYAPWDKKNRKRRREMEAASLPVMQPPVQEKVIVEPNTDYLNAYISYNDE